MWMWFPFLRPEGFKEYIFPDLDLDVQGAGRFFFFYLYFSFACFVRPIYHFFFFRVYYLPSDNVQGVIHSK